MKKASSHPLLLLGLLKTCVCTVPERSTADCTPSKLSPDIKLAPTQYSLNGTSERENAHTLKMTGKVGTNSYREEEQLTCRQTDAEKVGEKSCQSGEVGEVPSRRRRVH